MENNRDLYKILQVDPSAEQEIIEAAYKKLALKYHPDHNKSENALKTMQDINGAYEILHDPFKRAKYNETRSYDANSPKTYPTSNQNSGQTKQHAQHNVTTSKETAGNGHGRENSSTTNSNMGGEHRGQWNGEVTNQNEMNGFAILTSSGVSGVISAVLSNIPIISLVNCLLFGWIWGAGIYAVYLYRRSTNVTQVNTATGTILGAVTGLVSAIIVSLLGIAFSASATPLPSEQVEQLREVIGNGVDIFTDPAAMGAASFFINLIVHPIFGAIGGLIGSAIFKNRATPGTM